MPTFDSLAIDNPQELVFGTSPKPLTLRSGLEIGGGQVHPEINFTLPPMNITADSMSEVTEQYREMITGVAERAVELKASGLVVEFEMLPEMTLTPEWGIGLVGLLRSVLDSFAERGLVSGLRVTPNDTREFSRPPIMREGTYWEDMLRSFEGSARAGADMLSIESTGGKELHDSVMLNGDLPGIVFALGVLGARDMDFLWTEIDAIARRTGVLAAGDSA